MRFDFSSLIVANLHVPYYCVIPLFISFVIIDRKVSFVVNLYAVVKRPSCCVEVIGKFLRVFRHKVSFR